MSTIPTAKFQELLARAKQLAAQRKEEESEAAISSLESHISTKRPTDVDASNLGITPETLVSENGINSAVETLQEVVSAPASNQLHSLHKKRDVGVARDVSLNEKQQQFINTALKGEDVCLIGAAGTGKTTVVGKFIKQLTSTGKLQPLEVETKWLRPEVPGVLICSFTRKAVNNIRRAVPDELKPHTLTLHKVLEFTPVFYEVEDPNNPTRMKTTMKFEPQRTALNPLPASLRLVIYEESSMIGTDLYNLMQAAMPHAPQEIFIGDIRQLPPIFGPAILGFKMSLLPVVELTDVYRQALLSPIIRLAHSVLSGDPNNFSPKVEIRHEKHPHLDMMVDRKYVPALEKFNEDGEHGSVKFQIWQKKLSSELACDTTVKQFIAWERSGYYNPNDDLLLCPFNISFGTEELNKGIHQYLGKKRAAIVHEIIAGFRKHYLAIGDRILYDKEDAFITDIRRNVNYMGVAPQPASIHLDRWGTLQEELSEADKLAAQEEDAEFNAAAIDKFMESFSEEETRTTVASHAIYITFAYSEETITLSSAGEVNAIIGGHAITIHKAQGSEADSIFLVLHHSHAAMVQNELLYTAVTRARRKLHIICETDTFFKGVKSQKVRGVTLQDKIDFFKGKVEYKEMAAEMDMLKHLREVKKQRLQRDREWEEENKKLNDYLDESFTEYLEEKKQEKEDAIDSPYMDDLLDHCSTSIGSPARLGGIQETGVSAPEPLEVTSPSAKEKLLLKLQQLRKH